MKSSLGGEVFAFSEMLDHATSLQELFTPFVDAPPGMVALEDCESLFADLTTEKSLAE